LEVHSDLPEVLRSAWAIFEGLIANQRAREQKTNDDDDVEMDGGDSVRSWDGKQWELRGGLKVVT
jgi:hypothetical protein